MTVCHSASSNMMTAHGGVLAIILSHTKLVAFWTCNGCDEVLLNNQEGLLEKLERILSVKTDIVHVGICTEIIDEQTHKKVLCPKIQEIVDFLQKNNIKVVFGTHK